MTLNFKQQAWVIALFCAFASNSAFAIFDDTEARNSDLRQQVKVLEDRVSRMEAANQAAFTGPVPE